MRRRGRVDFREQLQKNQNSLDILAALSGKPRIIIDMPPPRKKRAIKVESNISKPVKSKTPLEADIQRAIIDMLLVHPKVGLVERINSGTAQETAADGTKRYIQFNRIYRKGLRKVDLDCTLTDGRRLVIEVKRPPWFSPKNLREQEQGAYIQVINDLGGVGLFATSVDCVIEKLKKV